MSDDEIEFNENDTRTYYFMMASKEDKLAREYLRYMGSAKTIKEFDSFAYRSLVHYTNMLEALRKHEIHSKDLPYKNDTHFEVKFNND